MLVFAVGVRLTGRKPVQAQEEHADSTQTKMKKHTSVPAVIQQDQ